MTKTERDALEAMALFNLQHVPCAESQDELVVRSYVERDGGRQITINANCPKCGAVTTATVSRSALAKHLAEAPTVAEILDRERKQ